MTICFDTFVKQKLKKKTNKRIHELNKYFLCEIK